MSTARFDAAVAAIDRANADDPERIMIDGVERPKEQAHAELMSAWLERLDPDASEAQRLAARAHHLRRWSIPRSSYDDGRKGYLRWRAALKKQHAVDVGEILRAAGYDEAMVAEVQRLVRKDGLGTDRAAQTHEDALCLVFLETQFDALADRLGDDKTVEVLQKTWPKMSDDGRRLALSLELTPHQRSLLDRALGG
jgi:Domain of unknown function (DUF4202)